MNTSTNAPGASTHPSAPAAASPSPTVAFSTLLPPLRRAIADAGYDTPTPIQEQCIPHLLDGKDLIGTAQTGTGKTAAFTLPILQRLANDPRRSRPGAPRALVLAPTRELAAQIGESVSTYGRHLRIRHTTIFGGVSQYHQVKALKSGVDIVVATPGRLLDLVQQGHLKLQDVGVFVLDEVDRMLDMGFLPDIKRVLTHVPEQRQTLFFSATMPPTLERLAYTLVRDPVRITISPKQPAVERIDQKVLFVGKGNKHALLLSLLNDPDIHKAIVFTQMKHVANRVVKKLESAGIRTAAIHGNKSQAARTRALDGFKQGRIRVLVATDVAARGIDVDDISHVINYDLPVEAETYVHRIGRTARAGATGDAISFCTAEDRACLTEIESLLGQPVHPDLNHTYHCDLAFRSSTRSGGNPQRPTGKASSGRRPRNRRTRYGQNQTRGQTHRKPC